MGIPHLLNHLSPYGVFGALDGDRVVIDGPALAYHIYHLCTRSTSGLPSYDLLGRTAIGWLEAVTSHDISISAIYFDGFLPASKAEVRLERILKVSSSLKVFRSGFPNGCPAKQISSTRLSLPPLFPTDAPKRDQPLIPPPAFLVAAIVDKLESTEKYASLVRLVPGEADSYCAEDVLRNGGTILTSDSDLTVHDLKTGSVAFFRDLHIGTTEDDKSALLGPKFSPSEIAKRLQLPEDQGMRRFAYELFKSTRPKFAQVLENCKGDISNPEEFRAFCTPYETLETIDWSAVPVLGSLDKLYLDARLSEVVLQCVGYSGVAKPPAGESGAAGCMMCLPPLLDCPARASAWDTSASVRQLAYSLTCLLRKGAVSHVREYRRMSSGVNQGKYMAMLPRPWIKDSMDALLKTLTKAKASISQKDSAWQAVSLQLILAHAQEEDKLDACLNSIKLAQSVAADSNLVPWDVVHLSAQVHATLYSLRILAQVLDLMFEIGAKDPIQGSKQLRELLSTLPSLTEFPSVDGTMRLLASMKSSGALGKVATALGMPADLLLPPKEAKNQKKKRKKMADAEPRMRPEKKLSSNPFDILGNE
ncbi:XPG domain containing-domain-containing protein [Colletotrichum godetiae]|uniref:XPG domain containing-domain-containing protein n=1 Tax=Colletotrichum godetiae TaxID=1209918 RepID=A0AAJ0EYI4_9PEZI|nr:XPG domain containing-domain-containing protein [Colletotrichum godetiae]KAK1700167.1 XPG domain containing-domain-containing protein [Colletotrichum godetiae]